MDIIDVYDVLEDDSFIVGDMEQLDDEVVEIFKQWKSGGTLPSCSGAIPSASGSGRFGFGGASHHSSNSGTNNNSSITGISNRNSSLHNDSKGSKYIDTRTFTRPKKKVDTTFNSLDASMETSSTIQELKVSSPLLNVHIGGPVTPSGSSAGLTNTSHLMQRSWLNDVSPPGSIMSSMDFSCNEKMGSSLITSGDFTNVSYLLNTVGNNNANSLSATEEMLNSQSSFDGYKLADVIKDRKFLESLSCFDDSTLTKDSAISRTDLNGIEGSLSGLSTMQNSVESVSRSGEGRLPDATIEGTAELRSASTDGISGVGTKGKLNSTFERRRNFDTYRKPKSCLNGTFDALPKVEDNEELKAINRTFDAVNDGQLDATFGVENNCNGTFSLNRTAKVNGAEKQLNQTYEYCEKNSPTDVAPVDRTFDATTNGTSTEPASPEGPVYINGSHIQTPNGTFELPSNRTNPVDTTTIVQSTPFVNAPRANRVNDISQYEVNVSPIAPHVLRRPEVVRRSRNLNDEMSASHLETDDFDVEFRKLPCTPNSTNKTESSNGSHLLESEKRISLQHFEEFEKSILESEHNGMDFDEMLNSLTDVKRSMDSVKLRQSLDNIKKRHSRINSEKQLEDLRKRTEMIDSLSSPLDNKLADSMTKSMSSSSGSERLLNRRSRYNDDVHLTLSPQQKNSDIFVHDLEQQPTNETKSPVIPPPTDSGVGGSDSKKNRDRFKTIRINKRLAEGMVVVPSPEENTADDGCELESVALPVEEELLGSPAAAESSAFSRVDYNSPKEIRLSAASNTTNSTNNNTTNSSNIDLQNKTEDALFKRPQGIVKPESKIRSLSKPRLYGGPGGAFGIARKDLSLPLATKSSSTDNLENDRPNFQQSPGSSQSRLSFGGKLGHGVGLVGNGGGSGGRIGGIGNSVPQSNLKSPMGTKSKSHHNLYYNQSGHGGSSGSLNRIPAPLGLAAQKTSHNNSNTELSGVQMRAPKGNASRLGLVRPSSGYFSYGSNRKNIDSDSESINSLSSSSASSRGSLYRVDSQSIANNVQSYATNKSIEDISGGTGIHSGYVVGLSKTGNMIEPNRTTTATANTSKLANGSTVNKVSGLRPPSNLRPPTARSALPRPTSYVRR